MVWESCVPRFARGLPSRRCCGRCVEMVVKERAVVIFNVGCTWCASCYCVLRVLSICQQRFPPPFGKVGAGRGLRIFHVNVLVFAHVGGFKGCISRSQVVVHFVGHGIAWIWNWRCFWGRLPLLEPWGFPCRPVFLKFGFEHWPHVIWHIQLNSCHVLVVGVHGA